MKSPCFAITGHKKIVMKHQVSSLPYPLARPGRSLLALTGVLLFLLVAFPALTPLYGEDKAADTPEAEEQVTSVEQRRLLQALQSERQNILKERREIEERKKELKRLEAEVDKKLDQLEEKRLELKKLLAEKEVREQKRIQELSKMYAKMSSEKAATILSAVDEQLAISILAVMKTKAAAKILNNMDRDKAAKLTKAFSALP